MSPAIATYAASMPAGPLYSGPNSFSPTDTANVVHVVLTGDFESVLTWAIGFRITAVPQVSVLTGPSRVVVDIPTHRRSRATRPRGTQLHRLRHEPPETGHGRWDR